MATNATSKGTNTMRDCYYTMSCTLSDLWLASVSYQSERALRLVRNRLAVQDQDPTSQSKTTLATLPNELFEQILCIIRGDSHRDYADKFPYVQRCECVRAETAWTKQIVMESFIERGKMHFVGEQANPPGVLMKTTDSRWVKHHSQYEETVEFRDLVSFVSFGNFVECHRCIGRWERMWRDIGGRTQPIAEPNKHAVQLVKTFLEDHHLATVENECWEDLDDGDEESGSPEYYSAFIAPVNHLYSKHSRYTEKEPFTASAAIVPFSTELLGLAKTHSLHNLRWTCLAIEEVYESEESEAENAESEVDAAISAIEAGVAAAQEEGKAPQVADDMLLPSSSQELVPPPNFAG